MSENIIKQPDNSAISLNENKVANLLHEMIELNKTKKKFYCLYKNGIKYAVKKKGKEKERNTINGSKYYKNINIHALESTVHNKFLSKYKRMPKYYNTYITHRLIHNINSHIVSIFKEYLIYGDIFEFLTKLYNKKRSLYLLKELLYYYITNNIIYPNYMVLPEGLYLFKNIQQKQRILDNQEENSKKKKKEKNEEDKILTSKIIDSILNQTDTSEARNCFGLDNNIIEGEEEEQQEINILIDTINKIENTHDKSKIFQRKKLIRIINKKDLKKNNFIKLSQLINKRNNNKIINYGNQNINANSNLNSEEEKKTVFGELISAITSYEDNKKQINSLTNKREIGKKYYIGKFNSININDNSNLLNSKYLYNINDKKMNTIDKTDIKPRKIRFGESKEENSRSLLNLNSPYIVKRPIKQSISYRKNISCNSYKNKINLKKINNKFYNFSPNKNNINININSNNNNIYQKKINKMKTLNILSTNPNANNKINLKINSEIYRTINKAKKFLNLKETRNPNIINTLTEAKEEPKIYKKIQNNNLNILKLSTYRPISAKRSNINKMKNINEISSNQNFKSISKMIKRKFIIDDDENIINTNVFHAYNENNISQSINKNNININRQKNKEKNINKIEDDIDNNKNNSQKNIYISNSITNNNYYTIENNPKKNIKFIFKKYLDKNENNKKKRKLLVINSRALNKTSHQVTNTLNINSQNSSVLNSARYNEKYDSNSVIKKWILSPYKNGLINETSLKSLDKYSTQNLLNKFNDKYNYKDKTENKLSINVNNSDLNYNQYNTINAQNNAKNENKIKEKKRYLILHNNRNINIKNLKNNNSRLIKVDHSDINHNNSFKTINLKNIIRINIPNLSEIKNKRNDKFNN